MALRSSPRFEDLLQNRGLIFWRIRAAFYLRVNASERICDATEALVQLAYMSINTDGLAQLRAPARRQDGIIHLGPR